MGRRNFLLALTALLFFLPTPSNASGNRRFTIVIPPDVGQEFLKIALTLSETMGRVSGQTVNVTTLLQDADVLPVWLATLEKPAPGVDLSGLDTLGEDGFLIRCDGKSYLVAGKTEKGLMNGCHTFLERVCGVRMLAPGVTLMPEGKTIPVKEFRIAEKPFFTFRELHAPAPRDDSYREWHKLDRHDDVYGIGGWVHTFSLLVPPSVYFENHPGYFSKVGGLRIPDGQLCLSNPEVLDVLTENLQEFWSVQPDAHAWSVSQNDTYKNCECSACRQLDSIYGGPSGTMIWFVNQVAMTFPGKEISTLAYQYTRQAPKYIIPAGNVTVVLCTIECDRGAPIAERDPSFMKDLSDWSKITSNILIWDYVVQFRNYLDPFPNLSVLQPNLQLFRKYGARQMFQQGSGGSWSDMIELKQYLISKLLWNPDADVSSEMNDFLNGYFGKAGPVVREYIDLLHKSMKDSGGRLGIYGFPFDNYKTFLTTGLLTAYNDLWDRAERLVSGDPELLGRVQKTRLPLLYAKLDISLHEPDPSMTWFVNKEGNRIADPKMIALLDTLVTRCYRFGIETLDENGTTPKSYMASIEEWLRKSLTPNLASSIQHPTSNIQNRVTLTTPASEKYPVGGAAALTDGLFGVNDYHFNWLGFEGNDMEAVIDLGEEKSVQEVGTTFLQFNQAWIFLPSVVEFSVSKDGIVFSDAISVPNETPAQQTGSFMQEFKATFGGEQARYLRVKATSLKVCPPWHGGHGLPCWIFCDEVVVK